MATKVFPQYSLFFLTFSIARRRPKFKKKNHQIAIQKQPEIQNEVKFFYTFIISQQPNLAKSGKYQTFVFIVPQQIINAFCFFLSIQANPLWGWWEVGVQLEEEEEEAKQHEKVFWLILLQTKQIKRILWLILLLQKNIFG